LERLAERFAAIPGVVAVTLGGSRATGTAAADSDWDFGLYYRGTIDPDDVRALGFDGRVFAPGDWGAVVNGGAWLTIDDVKVDLCYRDVEEVARWTAEADHGRFVIHRQVGYVAGVATYVLAGELALGQVLAGSLPRPAFSPALRATAPPVWENLARGALQFASVYAGRDEPVACLANVTQAVLAVAQARLAADGVWALNEKRIVDAAGLESVQRLLREPKDLPTVVAEVAAALGPIGADSVWPPRQG